GNHHNEFTRFRYDAILRINGSISSVPAAPKSLDWQESALSIERLRDIISHSSPHLLAIVNVPNARVMTEIKAVELLAREGGPEFAGELRKSLFDAGGIGIDPAEFWALGEALSYRTEVRWSKAPHCYDILFARQETEGLNGEVSAISPIVRQPQDQTFWGN